MVTAGRSRAIQYLQLLVVVSWMSFSCVALIGAGPLEMIEEVPHSYGAAVEIAAVS
jgi:hypothetical protein